MSQRDLIRMTDDELGAFLAERHVMNVATIGADGRPHLVAMWYGFLAGALAFWTYGKSQKVANLRRDPRLSALVEDGDQYDDLRGAELVATGTILEDAASVMEVGASVYDRYQGGWSEAARPLVERMGAKRVAVRLEVESVVSWDHRRLAVNRRV